METGFTNQETQNQKKSVESKIKIDSHTPGRITKTIGRGDDARNSFVYLTLRWAFFIGAGITILIVINKWFFEKDKMVPNIMGDISSTWKIVVPLITLALGYAFGKSKD
tara:strand:- start:44 stop:370 length:327 start_codon:yes stop_codon:yes gene_type:complete